MSPDMMLLEQESKFEKEKTQYLQENILARVIIVHQVVLYLRALCHPVKPDATVAAIDMDVSDLYVYCAVKLDGSLFGPLK